MSIVSPDSPNGSEGPSDFSPSVIKAAADVVIHSDQTSTNVAAVISSIEDLSREEDFRAAHDALRLQFKEGEISREELVVGLRRLYDSHIRDALMHAVDYFESHMNADEDCSVEEMIDLMTSELGDTGVHFRLPARQVIENVAYRYYEKRAVLKEWRARVKTTQGAREFLVGLGMEKVDPKMVDFDFDHPLFIGIQFKTWGSFRAAQPTQDYTCFGFIPLFKDQDPDLRFSAYCSPPGAKEHARPIIDHELQHLMYGSFYHGNPDDYNWVESRFLDESLAHLRMGVFEVHPISLGRRGVFAGPIAIKMPAQLAILDRIYDHAAERGLSPQQLYRMGQIAQSFDDFLMRLLSKLYTDEELQLFDDDSLAYLSAEDRRRIRGEHSGQGIEAVWSRAMAAESIGVEYRISIKNAAFSLCIKLEYDEEGALDESAFWSSFSFLVKENLSPEDAMEVLSSDLAPPELAYFYQIKRDFPGIDYRNFGDSMFDRFFKLQDVSRVNVDWLSLFLSDDDLDFVLDLLDDSGLSPGEMILVERALIQEHYILNKDEVDWADLKALRAYVHPIFELQRRREALIVEVEESLPSDIFEDWDKVVPPFSKVDEYDFCVDYVDPEDKEYVFHVDLRNGSVVRLKKSISTDVTMPRIMGPDNTQTFSELLDELNEQ